MPFDIRLTVPSFSKTKILLSSKNAMLVGKDMPPVMSSALRFGSLIVACAYDVWIIGVYSAKLLMTTAMDVSSNADTFRISIKARDDLAPVIKGYVFFI
jgi:hypothetical protein